MLHLEQLCREYGIGLTGGIATGKSTIAEILRTEGFLVLDADRLAREVVEPATEGLAAIVQRFGPTCLDAEGCLDRAKMRQIIFSDPKAREDLEQIIHPRLTDACWKALEAHGLPATPAPWFYEASLLFERGRSADFRQIWASICPRPLQIQRVMARDQITAEAAEAILKAQLPPEEKAKRAHRVIATDCSRAELEERVRQTLREEGILPSVSPRRPS